MTTDYEIDAASRVDHWWTVATADGLFTRPREDGATFTGTWLAEDRIRFEIAFRLGGKIRRIRGTLVEDPRAESGYSWRYTRRGIALGGRVGLSRTADGSLLAIHLPPTMISNGGCILLARPDVAHAAAPDRISRALAELNLTRAEYQRLLWRAPLRDAR